MGLVCNNIIIYVLLKFEKHIDAFLLDGDPSNAYGATFGRRHRADYCDEQEVEKFLNKHNVTALFTTASYLDIKYGPHVSSSANHKLKRILNKYAEGRKECLNFFVIAAEKINNDVTSGKISAECKLIFDPEGSPIDPRNKQSLDKVERDWMQFISRPNNIIVSGSPQTQTVNQIAEELKRGSSNILVCPIPATNGELLMVKGEARKDGQQLEQIK